MNSLSKHDGTTLSVAQIATLSEVRPARTRTALKPNVAKLLPKVKRQQQQLLTRHSAEDDDGDNFDEIDFQIGFRRPTLVDDDEEQLSDHVMDRLANARALALAAYRTKWSVDA